MKTITATTTLSCAPETFWATYLSPEYARALYLEVLRYDALEVLESTATTRKLRVKPRIALPGPIAKALGGAFEYEDHGTLDRARNEWTWRMIPLGKGVVTTRGTIRVEPIGPDRCRRTDELTIEAHVFGLGGLIESSAEKEARAAWDKEFVFLAREVEKRRT